MVCPRCGSEAPVDALFCPACGSELRGQGRHEERKVVSVLFVDMVGSTARADGADPEDVRALNLLYQREASERIERFGGVMEKFIGDAVMAVFGAPLARDDDAERAVRAALSILEGIEEMNERQPGLELEVRAAVDTGEAVVTLDGSPGEPLATGDVVNTAARLQSAAPPSGVIVGEQTHRLTQHAFTFEELVPVEAKGKREPVRAWLIGAPLAAPADRPTSTTPVVGRVRELELIRSVWERVLAADQPHLLTVLGPPGIGKSRLGQEATDELERGGARVLWGRSLPYAEQTPYRAVSEIIGGAAGVYENDPPAEARPKLGDLVAAVFPSEEVSETTRYLSLLLGLGLDEPADDAIHLQYAARRLVEELAARDPLVVVFEDAHWADDSLLDLIDYLVTRVKGCRVLFLALARPELIQRRPTWGTGMMAKTTMPLDPLSAEEAMRMVLPMVTGDRVGALEKVVATAEGNPLFLEELVAALDTDPAGAVPLTVRAAIVARIDALPPDARVVLLRASVMGQTFWREVVVSVAGLDDIDEPLDALEARGLVQRHTRSRVAGDVEYAFKHALIRDAAYEMLPRATRRELHAATARTIEDRTKDPAEIAWILAYHWREAGESDRAVTYYLTAAARARDAMAPEETWDLYTRALELASSDPARTTIRLQRAIALVQFWDLARADRELAELTPDLDGVEEVEALLARGRATLWTEQTEETFLCARRALELAPRQAPELEPIALALLSHAHAMRGELGDLEPAIELGDRALALWPPGWRLLELSEHLHLHADTTYWTGSYERALGFSWQSAAVGDLDPHSAEFVLRGSGMAGLILAGMGRYEEAIAAGEGAIETARRLGLDEDVVTNYSTGPLRDIFSLDEAHARSEGVVSRNGPSDFNMPWMNARADLLGVDLLRGAYAEVERTWETTWEDAVSSSAWERWLISGRVAAVKAQFELEVGRPEEALVWARRAVEMARPVARKKYETIGLITVGRALTALRSGEDAVVELGAAVALADDLGTPLYRWQARAALALAERAVPAAAPNADRDLQDAIAIIRAVAASLAPERAAVYLAARPVAEVLGQAG